MPRYLIERTFSVDEDQMPDVGRRSKTVAVEQFPEIVWEHSHVVVNDEGTVRTYCIYSAPDEDMLLRHSVALGKHTVDSIQEIAGDVTPDDFPL
jgi:hypothetical protein